MPGVHHGLSVFPCWCTYMPVKHAPVLRLSQTNVHCAVQRAAPGLTCKVLKCASILQYNCCSLLCSNDPRTYSECLIHTCVLECISLKEICRTLARRKSPKHFLFHLLEGALIISLKTSEGDLDVVPGPNGISAAFLHTDLTGARGKKEDKSRSTFTLVLLAWQQRDARTLLHYIPAFCLRGATIGLGRGGMLSCTTSVSFFSLIRFRR